MATDAERNKAAASERRKRQKDLPRIQRDTAGEIGRLLRRADRDLRAQIAKGGGSDFARWLNPQLRQSVRGTLDALGTDMGKAMVAGAETAWDAGVALVDASIDAALTLDDPQARIAAHLASVDLRQLGAMREFLTAKMSDVSLQAINRVNTALGLGATGVRSIGEVVGDVAKILGSSRKRGVTIVRTELGRAYSIAGQARMTQARERLPGLKKQWRRSGKIHSRIEHDAADGQIREVDQPFKVGGVELMYPRDPAGPARHTINCGCQSLPYISSWAESDALLHPKRRPFTEEEIAFRPMRADLNEPAPVRERIGDTPDAPVVVRSADPGGEYEIPAPIPDLANDPRFAAFLRGEAGTAPRPVAIAPTRIARALDTRAQEVLLSRDTGLKQVKHGLAPADYARLSEMMARGTMLRSKLAHIDLILEIDGRSWTAVVKKAQAENGSDEIYVVSMRRSKPRDVRRLHRRGKVISEEE